MIREDELQEAIAECEGARNPNASTCLKLAAFYTIRDHMKTEPPVMSFAPAPETVQWEGDSEFARVIRELPISHIMPIMDELMDALLVLNPKLYDSVIRKLQGWV